MHSTPTRSTPTRPRSEAIPRPPRGGPSPRAPMSPGAGPLRRGAILLLASGTAAQAGPLDRSGRPIDVIFEPGGYVQFSLGYVWPSTSGLSVLAVPPFGVAGVTSGDVTENFAVPGAALKLDLTSNLSAAVIYDQPLGADLDYPLDTGFVAAGIGARVDTHALTGLLRYRFTSALSVHGGVRYQTYDTDTQVPLVVAPVGPNAGVPYDVAGERDGAFGYVLGAAFEVPQIAGRISLTYNSEIAHELDTIESGPAPGRSTTDITTPRSLDLSFQTGVAPDTLLFGSVRWTDASAFRVTPVGFLAATGNSILDYDEDTYDYSLGLGRRFSERWAGAVTFAYSPAEGELSDVFGPTDGAFSVGLGATYVFDPVEVTAGVSYAWLGDGEVSLDGETVSSVFEDNEAVAVGIEIAYRF